MKKIFTFTICALLTLAMCFGAWADIAYEPRDDFYEKHWDECAYENRMYYINGENGYTVGYVSPTSNDVRAVFPNSGPYYVSYTYSAGEVWGCIEYDPDTLENAYLNASSCWVKMSDLVNDYDCESFFDNHKDEIEHRDVSLTLSAGETAAAWKYPGSGILVDTIGVYSGDSEDIMFSQIFTDPQGREWGYLSYYYGHRNMWICLSDPFSESLEPDENFVQPQLIPAASPQELAAVAEDASSRYVLLAGTLGVVIIAGAVLASILLRRRRPASTKE